MDALRERCRWVTGLLVSIVVTNVSSIATGAWQLHFLQDVSADQESEGTGDLIDSIQGFVGSFQLCLLSACGIAFLMWIHRAHFNLTLGRLRGLTYTLGKAVGSFFMPIVNFVRPYRVMKEIWSGSAYLLSGDAARSWKETPSPSLIAWWWCLFLGSSFLGRAYAGQVRHVQGVAQLIGVTTLGVIADAIDLVAAVLAAVIVHRISTMQEEVRIRSLLAAAEGR